MEWFWFWMIFVFIFLLLPLGYGWGYRRLGAPYPSYYARTRTLRGTTVPPREADLEPRAVRAQQTESEMWASLATLSGSQRSSPSAGSSWRGFFEAGGGKLVGAQVVPKAALVLVLLLMVAAAYGSEEAGGRCVTVASPRTRTGL